MKKALVMSLIFILLLNCMTAFASYTGQPLGFLTNRLKDYAFKYSNTSGGAIMYVGGQPVAKATDVAEYDKNDILSLLKAAQINGCMENASKDEKIDFRGQISILRTAVKTLGNSEEIIYEINNILSLDSILTDLDIAEKKGISFLDVNKSHWFYEDVTTMASKNYISGKSEPVNGVGKFYPYDTITRAEFIAIVMRIMHPKTDFSPTGNEPWWSESYKVAVSNGFIEKNDIQKSPEIPITREEMAYITFMGLKKKRGTPPDILIFKAEDIPDYNTIDERYSDEILAIRGVGIIMGNENGYINPKSNLTRAEASAVLNRLINRIEDGVYYY